MSKRIVTAFILLGLTFGVGVTSDSFIASAGVPNCVELNFEGKNKAGMYYASIYNRCKTQQRVRIDWANALDSECFTLAGAGETGRVVGRSDTRTKSLRFMKRTPFPRGLKSC